MAVIVYTIGHSVHPLNRFLELLKKHDITAVADVRSNPYSRLNPQYNEPDLAAALKSHGIRYVFLGKELGARSEDPGCYDGDQVQYSRLARTDLFQSGLDRVRIGADKHRIALMCAEKEPLDCHRTILVSRQLVELGLNVRHILSDGRLEDHRLTMDRLMVSLGLTNGELFRTDSAQLAEAYERQADKIAYRRPHPPEGGHDELGSV